MENLNQEGRLECTNVDERILNEYIKRILSSASDIPASGYREMTSTNEHCSGHSDTHNIPEIS
jgi:hypothetical protein